MGNQLPQIPGTPEPEVRSEAMPTPFDDNRITPDNMGLGNQIGNATEEAGKLTADYGAQRQQMEQKAQNDADNTAVAKAVSASSNAMQDAFYGTGDKPGFSALQGENAAKYSGKTLSDFDQQQQKIRATLASPAQQEKFDHFAQEHADGLRRLVNGHAARQVDEAHRAAEVAMQDANLRSIANTAADMNQDVSAVHALIKQGAADVVGLAATRAGADDATMTDMRTRYIAAAAQKALEGVTSITSDSDADNAAAAARIKSITSAYGEQLGPAVAAKYNAIAKAAGDQASSSVKANKILEDASKDLTPGAAPGSKLKLPDAGKIQDALAAMPFGAERDRVTELVHRRAVEATAAVTEHASQIADQIRQLGDPNSTGRFIMPKSAAGLALMKQLHDIDEPLLTALHKEAMNEDAKQLSLMRLQNETTKAEAGLELTKQKTASSAAAFTESQELQSRPEAYKDMSAQTYVALVSKRHPEMLQNEQKQLMTQFDQLKGKELGKFTIGDVNESMRGAGMSKSNIDRDGELVRQLVQAWIDSRGDNTPNKTEVLAQINHELAMGSVIGGGIFFGDANDVRRYETETPGKGGGRYAGKEFVPKIPEVETARAAPAAPAKPPVAPGGIVDVSSKEERAKLPPGTRYRYKGAIATVGAAK